MTYLSDVAALARKDLRLELRARETLPAMVLFVLATLVVFHFALPGGSGTGSEILLAARYGRPVIAYAGSGDRSLEPPTGVPVARSLDDVIAFVQRHVASRTR